VDAFHAALTAAGCRDGGAPDEQPVYHPGYFAAYVLDPDDNSVELVCHDRERGEPAGVGDMVRRRSLAICGS
jgi:hypothetical protein